MKRLREVFEGATSDAGVWTIAFPRDEFRDRPLFQTFDLYGGNVADLIHTLTVSKEQWNDFAFTEALLDFDLAGEWMASMRKGGRFSDSNEMRFRFNDPEDITMFKLFGALGTAQEIRPRTMNDLPERYVYDEWGSIRL